MPKVDVVDLNNKKVGEVELADAVFAAEVNQDLLYEAVRHYLAGRRAGTHKTKARHEVAGSGKKLWKQKGTGRARMGSVRSPIWRHGGTVHGPVPRDYSYKLPRKMQLGALRSALSAKLRDGEMKIISAFQLADHKTKSCSQTLGKLEATRKVLVVENGENRNLELSARNLEGVVVVRSREVHPYLLLDATRVLLTQAAAAKLSETLAKSVPSERGPVMTIHESSKRPLVTEKGITKKEEERTLCFEVAKDANKIMVKQAVEKLFKVKVEDVRTANFEGKLRRRGTIRGLPFGLEESIRETRGGPEGPRVHGDVENGDQKILTHNSQPALHDGRVARGHYQRNAGEIARRAPAEDRRP